VKFSLIADFAKSYPIALKIAPRSRPKNIPALLLVTHDCISLAAFLGQTSSDLVGQNGDK